MATALSWFEIPTTDLDRAIRFYETVLAVSMRREVFEGVAMAVFPHGDKAPGGALIQDAKRRPASDGVLIFLNAGNQLDACLERIAKAGGKVLTPKLDIGAPGFIATLRDTEGNVVALHQER